MSVTTNPPAKESSKQRALRIEIAHYRRGDAIVRAKFTGMFVCTLAAAAYLAWIVWGGRTAADQLSPAPLARVHAKIQHRCGECHTAWTPLNSQSDGLALLLSFARTHDAPGSDHAQSSDASCAKCHPRAAAVPHHQNMLKEEATRCAACHVEHRGVTTDLARVDDRACTHCHSEIAAHRGPSEFASPIGDVSQFAAAIGSSQTHPPFRSVPASEASNHFRFNHQLHMLPGQWPADGKASGGWTIDQIPVQLQNRYQTAANSKRVQLDCASCHEVKEGTASSNNSAYFPPVNFERHCRACHSLQAHDKERVLEMRHGLKQAEVLELLRGFERAGSTTPATDKPQPLTPKLPIPGKTPGNNLAQSLAESSPADRWQRKLFQESCTKCHVDEATDATAAVDMRPRDLPKPRIPERWFTLARFDHAAHRTWSNCRDCHAGAYPEEAAGKPRLDDARVLVPNIDNCAQCHAAQSTHPKFQSSARFDCAECHRYHPRPVNSGAK